MTFLDYFRNPLDRAHNAPASRTNPTVRRRNRIQPDLPREREGFADYIRRTGTAPELTDAAQGPRNAIRAQRRALENQVTTALARIPREEPSLLQAFGEGAVEEFNRPTPRLLDIPMAQHLLGPDTKHPNRNLEPGRDVARGYTLRNANVTPANARQRGGMWVARDNPDRGIGLIMYGADLRRSLNDIFSDVERVAGGPSGYLARLAGHESGSDVNATPGTSSATGFFQVIDGTWSRYATDPNFREAYGMPAMSRAELMDYRGDARVDGAIALEIARDNAETLRSMGVERVTEKALYMGHFGGGQGLAMARDQARGAFRHQFAASYFSEAQVAANEPVFFRPKLGSDGRPLYRTVERDGRTVRIQIGDRNRPYTSQEVWDRLTRNFSGEPVTFGPRASGRDGALRDAPGGG